MERSPAHLWAHSYIFYAYHVKDLVDMIIADSSPLLSSKDFSKEILMNYEFELVLFEITRFRINIE